MKNVGCFLKKSNLGCKIKNPIKYLCILYTSQRELYVKKPMKNIFLGPNTKMGMAGIGTIRESCGFKY